MSVGIVRVAKMGSGSVKGIEIHDRREKDGISHTNKDIDWERTSQNYDLHHAQNQNFHRAVKERITELQLPKAVRKDAVVMAQVLVTSDHDFFKGLSKGQQEQFFKDSYDFLKERYGEKNIVSATVHLDERTPHMHFNFVPVTEDGRLSAKSILTRQSLIEQQDKFQECVGQKYGLQRGMTKEERIEKGVQRKNFTVPEYKALTAEIQRKEIELAELKEKALKARESVLKAQDEEKVIKSNLTPLKAEYEAKKAYVRECDKSSDISMAIPSYAEVEKKGLFKKQEFVTVPKEKWLEKHVSANEKSYLERATKEFESVVTKFKQSSTGEYVEELERKVKTLEKENHSVKTENYLLKKDVNSKDKELDKVFERVNQALGKIPDEAADRFVKEFKAAAKTIEHGMSR